MILKYLIISLLTPDNFIVLVPPGFLSPIVLISVLENTKPKINDHGTDDDTKLIKIHSRRLII